MKSRPEAQPKPKQPSIIEKEKKIRPVHIEYISGNTRCIHASGGFFPDDDDFPNGGLIILDRL